MSSMTMPTWFKDYLARYKRGVAAALALGLVASACAALLMFTSGYLISATALAGTTLFSILIPVACVQLFGFGRPLARYLERLASHDWVLRVTSDLRLALYRAVDERTGDPALARATGEYLGLLSDDVAHLQNLYLRVVFPSCIAYLLAIGASVVFGFFSLPFALVVIGAFVLTCVALPFACLLATRMVVQRAKSAKADEYTRLSDDVYGAIDWALAGRGQVARGRHAADDAAIRALEARARMTQRTLSLVATVLLAVLLCAVVAWSAGRFGIPGQNVNWIAAFALGFFPLIESFAVLPVAFSESTAHRDSLSRLDEYLDSAGTGDCASAEGEARAPSQQGRPESAKGPGSIEFEEVSYTYPGASRPALDGFSITVQPTESVAVLGRSGAGKSTFADVLRGALAPQAGSVTVAGVKVASGLDFSQVVGLVGQSPYLFNRTLRDNLTLGVLEADDGRLAQVLRDVGLGGKLESLEDGLDTVIGETGVGLSGGEAHRVAIARVLVADTPVVVVDEPFSALDPETERDLLDTLLRACERRTLVVVTHHLAQIERFDRVLFVEDGSIALDGSPAELLQSSSRFRSLVDFDRA